ncbi:MAG: DMT family transporter [Actinomycetota bacterium]
MGHELRLLAILLAVGAAVALAYGAQFQNQAVSKGRKKTTKARLSIGELVRLLTRPRWMSGLGLMAVGMILQLAALSLAPLIVVQPVGAIALVITSLLNAKATHTRLNRGTVLAIGLSSFGVGGFVITASTVAKQVELTDQNLLTVLGLLAAILIIFAVLFFTIGKRTKALTYIVGAGVLYGFVATLAKVVIQRLYQMDYDLLTLLALSCMVGAVFLGGWFVQNAYASGPPDLVIAGLTVIDPMVAIAIAIGVLGEAREASFLSGSLFVASAAVAISGVLLLSRVHPELRPKGKTLPS